MPGPWVSAVGPGPGFKALGLGRPGPGPARALLQETFKCFKKEILSLLLKKLKKFSEQSYFGQWRLGTL